MGERAARETVRQGGFSTGQRVVIHDFDEAPDLEKSAGTIGEWLADEGKWQVSVDGRPDVVLIEPSHLLLEGQTKADGPKIIDEGPPQLRGSEAKRQAPDAVPGDIIEVFNQGAWLQAQVLEDDGSCPQGYLACVQLEDGAEVIVPKANTRMPDNHKVHRRRVQACELAQRKLDQKQPLKQDDVIEVLRLWPFQPNASRRNVLPEGKNWVYSDTFGLVNTRGSSQPCVNSYLVSNYPEIMMLLARWLRETAPGAFKNFPFTSVNVNSDYAACLHRDRRNVGPSLLRAFGEFTGGRLRYYPQDDHSLHLDELAHHPSTVVDTVNSWCLIDGNRAHAVEDFAGERFSVVFYSISSHGRATKEQRRALIQAGAKLPTKASMQLFCAKLPKPRGYGEHDGGGDGRRRHSVSGRERSRSPETKTGGRKRWRSGSLVRPPGPPDGSESNGQENRRTGEASSAAKAGDEASEQKLYKVLQFPHLDLRLTVGETYSHARLVQKCRGQRGKLAALRTKLLDTNTFELVTI